MLTPNERSRTVCFLRRLRREDGGYSDQAANSTSGLKDTLSVLKALHLLHAGLDDPTATLEFVQRCSGAASGGFSDRPGGEPTVFSTAMGLIALRELGEANSEDRTQAAMRFMTKNAVSSADHFMIIAFHEECALPGPAPPCSVSFFRAQRQGDGTFGASARANAIAYAALLRAGEAVERSEPVISHLLAAQGSDGGFADVGGASDLMTTYAAMRALTLLRTAPDMAGLMNYVAALRQADGGYGPTRGAPATATATYQVLSILRWIERLSVLTEACGRQGLGQTAADTWRRRPRAFSGPISKEDIRGVVEAAREGDVATLAEWLASGGDPNQYAPEGWTPLLAGAVRGQAEVVDLLLFHDIPGARRASPRIRFVGADALPIYMAGQSGDLETVKVILKARPQDLFEVSSVNGHTVMLQAAFYGSKKHQAIAEYLLENVAEILCLPENDEEAVQDARKRLTVATNVRGYNALGIARLWQNEPMAALFERFDQTTEAERNAYLEDLLNRIAPPEPENEQVRRAQALTESLVDAIQNGFKRAEKIPPDATEAVAEARREIIGTIRGLVETPGFEINRLGGRLLQPPIVVAVTGVDTRQHTSELRRAIAAYLLERGADPDLPEKHPMAVDAVIRAAVLNHLDILKLVAQYMTPDAFAAAMNEKPAVNGLTALHDSVHRALTADPPSLPRHLEQIRWMVEHGARSDIEDYTGQTQEQMARTALDDSNFKANALVVLEALGLGRRRT